MNTHKDVYKTPERLVSVASVFHTVAVVMRKSCMIRVLGVLVSGAILTGLAGFAGTATLVPDGAFVSRSWRVGQGLPQDSVWAITQTRDGYLWVGTGAGLARFDGVQFKVFGLGEGLPALHVRALLEDQSGGLWVGTGNGLARFYRGRVEGFANQEGLAGARIISLAEDRDGSVWIGTPRGVIRWRAGAFDAPAPSITSVRVLAADAAGSIWVEGFLGGLLRWDGTRFRQIGQAPEMRGVRPNRLCVDSSGRMWAATESGVFSHDGTNWQSYRAQHGLPEAPIVCIATGPDGAVWAGSEDQGLYRLDAGAASFVRVNAFNRDFDAVRSLYQDLEGNLWIGTRSAGLTCLRPAKVAVWAIQDDETQGLPFSMTELGGSLLASSVGRGLYRFGRGGEAQPFMRSALEPYGLRTGVLYASREGDLWLVSGARLLLARNGKIRQIFARGGASSICQDREGTIWIGTSGGVLKRFRADRVVDTDVTLAGATPTSIVADPDGGIWVGAYGHSILHILGERRESYGKEQGLASDLVRVLYRDSSGAVWAGTEGGGLSRIQQGRVFNFGKGEGVPTDTILQVLEDDDGYLWLGTYEGIIRVSRHQLNSVADGRLQRVQARVFGRSDGMRSEQCMSAFGGAVKLGDGRLCFATGDGVVVVDPKQHRKGSPPPKVRIEEVTADRQAVELAADWLGASDQRDSDLEPLRIGPGRKRLQVNYTALSFSAPEQVRFRHRLAGLDDEWVDAGDARTVEYSYLPPGRYRFELTAHSGTGVWADPPLAMVFVLKPFVWQTTWFRVGGAVVLVGVAVLLVRGIERRRARAQMRRLELEGAMERERARIARDIHDDLGSRLTKISMITHRVIQEGSPGSTLANHLRSISETARDMLDRLDETVWVVNPRNDQLDRLCDYLLNYAQDFLQHAGIRCRFKVVDDLPPLPVAAETRHHVFLIVKEALNNVARHSGATEARIELDFTGNKLSLTIKDNGRGFDTAACLALGRGLENMRSRAGNIGGRFDLESQPGQGATVRMEFKMDAPGPGSGGKALGDRGNAGH